MSYSRFPKSAIAVAVLSLSTSLGVFAQGIAGGGTSGGSGPSVSSGAPPASSRARSDDSLTRGDRAFLEKAAKDGMAEVEIGRLAQQKATHPQVKEFAARMVEDHTKANERLEAIARAGNVEWPTKLDSKHRRTLEKLQKASGAEFDREYMKEMKSEHRNDVSEFEKASKSAKDPQVKNFATQTLPTLREHREMAESTSKALGERSTLSMRPDSTSRSQPSSQNR